MEKVEFAHSKGWEDIQSPSIFPIYLQQQKRIRNGLKRQHIEKN